MSFFFDLLSLDFFTKCFPLFSKTAAVFGVSVFRDCSLGLIGITNRHQRQWNTGPQLNRLAHRVFLIIPHLRHSGHRTEGWWPQTRELRMPLLWQTPSSGVPLVHFLVAIMSRPPRQTTGGQVFYVLPPGPQVRCRLVRDACVRQIVRPPWGGGGLLFIGHLLRLPRLLLLV